MIDWVDVDLPVFQTERAKEAIKKSQWIKKKDTMKKGQVGEESCKIKGGDFMYSLRREQKNKLLLVMYAS